MKLTRRIALATAAAVAIIGAVSCSKPETTDTSENNDPAVEEKTEFKVAWSIYVGWMPWGYAEENGIVDKWAEKYNIDIEVTQFNDYIESINQYTAGGYDAVTLTNMDGLSIPSAGGVDTTAVIVGDFSNGNDALFLKDTTDLADIKGQNVNLVKFSVSHYLLARALDTVELTEADVTVVNTADPDMVGAFQTSDVTALVTWNPMVAEIANLPDANKLFNSADIPGEIIDLMVANTETLSENPEFGKALAGIWYETMALMTSDTEEGAAARAAMGAASGTDQAGYEAQMAATELFANASDAVAFVESPALATTTEKVSTFLFDKGLLGPGAESAGAIGVELADGSIFGDENNVKFRYTAEYMTMAANGEL